MAVRKFKTWDNELWLSKSCNICVQEGPVITQTHTHTVYDGNMNEKGPDPDTCRMCVMSV